MPPKINPLRLNKLQLKTLTLFQELARHPQSSTRDDETGGAFISNLPRPHGNHFHVGERIAAARDATGLANPSVWTALQRKGLVRSMYPHAVLLTAAGIEYDTGMRDQILLGGDH